MQTKIYHNSRKQGGKEENMTVKELIRELENQDENATVILGVEGYTTTGNGTTQPESISVEVTDSYVAIVDNAFYEEVIW